MSSTSATRRLAVYGSLAPGQSNHFMVANHEGTWTPGRVRGDLVNAGWGAAGGFPGLIPREDGPWVAVQVLESESLANAWRELDEFEGEEYRRVAVVVYADAPNDIVLFEAQIYALAR
jgi:gamma-glutamylcyclotransferase (GGCT)/AIG2-like uncharacterized protein YtfP